MKLLCSNLAQRLTTCIIGATLLGSIYFFAPSIYTAGMIISGFLWVIFVEWPSIVSPKKKLFWMVTPIYLVLPTILALLLNHNETTRPLLLWTVIITFSHDIFAYFVGTFLGTHRWAPAISPLKTWEGCFGGFIQG